MELLTIVFGLLLQVLIVVAVIGLIVVAVRRSGGSGEEPTEPGVGTVRRVFYYGLAFVALMLATTGVTFLLAQVLDTLFGQAVIRDDSFRIAFGLAATIVGLPIWALLRLAAERSVEQYPAERGTLGRKLYVYLVLGVSAAVTAGVLVRLVQGILAPTRFEVEILAPVIVWSALWAVHWRWEQGEGQSTSVARSVRRLYAYVTSTYGLVLLAVGTGLLLAQMMSAAYDSLMEGAIFLSGAGLWTAAVQDAISLAVVGGVWWWFHWHRLARGDTASLLRQVVIYLIAVFGGLVTTVGAAAAVLLAVLLWLFDREAATPAVNHFAFVPGALAAILVGTGLWRYHSEVVLHEAAAAGERLVSARRAYRYLTAAVGLGTLATGLAFLFGLAIGLLVPGARGDLTGVRWWAGPAATVLTLIIVGAPLWWRYWSVQQRTALEGVPGEREALSRRIFIFGVFGIAVLATLASLSTFLVLVLQPLLEGRLTPQVLDGGKWALGVALTAGTISVYYWQVLREDREALVKEGAIPAPPAPVRRIEVTALAPAGATEAVNAIAAQLGIPVVFWRRQDTEATPDITDAQIQAAAEQIRQVSTSRVLLVIDGGGVQVVPFSG